MDTEQTNRLGTQQNGNFGNLHHNTENRWKIGGKFSESNVGIVKGKIVELVEKLASHLLRTPWLTS